MDIVMINSHAHFNMASSRGLASMRLAIGLSEFGKRSFAKDEQCHKILDEFMSLKYNELDTAHVYAEGKSEECVGRYSKKSQYVIATKVNPWNDSGLKYDSVLEQMRISLERLQLPSVDILYLHAPDHNTPIEETLSAIQKLYEEGKFKEFGLSNYASWEVAQIYYICKDKGWVLPTIYQGMYNPIARMVEGELFPCLRNFGMRFYAYNPLAGGLLTGKFKYDDIHKNIEGRFFTDRWTQSYRDRYWRESVFKGINDVRSSLDKAYGKDKVSLVSGVFRWMNHHSGLDRQYQDAIIIGGSNVGHIIDNVKACEEGPLEQGVVDAFNEAWQFDKAASHSYYR